MSISATPSLQYAVRFWYNRMGGINKLVKTSNDSPRSPHKHAKLKTEVIEFKHILLEA